MRAILIIAVLSLAACTEQAPIKKPAASDDGCTAYLIKPDGTKRCM